MPKLFSRIVEIHYEGLLSNLFEAIKKAKTQRARNEAEAKFDEKLFEICTNYNEERAHRMVKKYDGLREDYKLEQRIETSD